MGGSYSRQVEDKLKTQDNLLQQIHLVSQELSELYANHFLHPDFCNRIALIYNDKLMAYQKQEIDNISYTLGLVNDVPNVKSKICQTIVNHYTERLNLIAGIQSSLSYVSDRIYALTTGPMCLGNPEIFDQQQCKTKGGQWLPVVIRPDDNVTDNKLWYTYIDQLQSRYLTDLQQLLLVLDQLKRFDRDITDEQLKLIGQDAKLLIEQMHQYAHELYQLILTTKTMSPEEQKLYNEQQLIKQQETEARQEALKIANGFSESSTGLNPTVKSLLTGSSRGRR